MKYIELPSLTGLASSLSHQGPECTVSVRLEAYSCKNIKRDKRLFRDLEKVYWDDMGVLEGMKYDLLEESSKSPPTEAASSPHSFLAQAHSALPTPFGPLGSPYSRKTLYLLIATLNVAFPDYTFDSVKPSSFIHLESGAHILNALSTTLLASKASSGSPISSSMAYGAYPAAQGLGFGVAQGSPESPYEFIKESPSAPSSLISGTHPEIYALLDDVIGLDECEVFEYVPEPEEDPNAGEGEVDDDDDFEDEFEEYSLGEDEVFALDEDMGIETQLRSTSIPNSPPTPRDAALSSSTNPISPFNASYRPRLSLSSPTRSRFGAHKLPTSSTSNPLLWSSHWFFLNRKQKRILYVSVWARKRSLGSMLRTPVDEEYFVNGNETIHHLYASVAGRSRPLRKFSESDDSDGSPVTVKFPTTKSGSRSLTEKERFLGWEGAAGAGARALGLSH